MRIMGLVGTVALLCVSVPALAQSQPEYLLVLRNAHIQCMNRMGRAYFHILEVQFRHSEKVTVYIVKPPLGMAPTTAADLLEATCGQFVDGRPTFLEADAYRRDVAARFSTR